MHMMRGESALRVEAAEAAEAHEAVADDASDTAEKKEDDDTSDRASVLTPRDEPDMLVLYKPLRNILTDTWVTKVLVQQQHARPACASCGAHPFWSVSRPKLARVSHRLDTTIGNHRCVPAAPTVPSTSGMPYART
eukprot:42596-Prymnesium_polylepis.3